MKRIMGLFLGVVLLSCFISSQTQIENPSEAKNEKAGRILELEELFRITDENPEFFFKRPYRLNLDQNGFIYFQDGEFFLKFSPEGTFMKDLANLGQGPGEVQSFSYNIQGSAINAWDTQSKKVVIYDLDGQFFNEFRPNQHHGMRMVGHYRDSLIFSTYDVPIPEERKGMINVNHHIYLISKDTGEEKEIGTFSLPWYVTASSGAGYAPFLVVPNRDGSVLFINDSSEYRIKVMDTSTGKILRIFQRKYKRVKAPVYQRRPGDTRPERKFLYDISSMVMNEEKIWIRTSTQDENKGVFFDVFSQEGEYIDAFYIPVKVSFMYVKGNILFARVQDENGIYSVVKYRILN